MTEFGGADYGLPLEFLEQTFRDAIVPDYLLRGRPSPQLYPEVVLLGGQPGAGKSATAVRLREGFTDRGGIVWVTRDDFRPYHPAYERLLAERPAEMADVTRPATMWWQERAARYLREERYNTLLECAFREPRTVMNDASRFAQAEYRTHVSALAVPAALSRLGIIERFAAQVAATGTGRWTTAASHDADYVGTAETVGLAEASPDVSRISLWTRDGLIFDSSRSLAGGPAEGRPVELLAEARNTPLTRLQRVALAERLAETLARLEAAGMAHPAAYEMAGEVERDLGIPLAQLSAWRQRRDAAASSESSSTQHPEPEAG